MCVIGIQSDRYLSIVGWWGSNPYQVSCYTILESRYAYMIGSVQGQNINILHPIIYKYNAALFTTQGTIAVREQLDNWLLPGSAGVQCKRHSSATECDICTQLFYQSGISQAFEFADFDRGPRHEFILRYQVLPFGHAATMYPFVITIVIFIYILIVTCLWSKTSYLRTTIWLSSRSRILWSKPRSGYRYKSMYSSNMGKNAKINDP